MSLSKLFLAAAATIAVVGGVSTATVAHAQPYMYWGPGGYQYRTGIAYFDMPGPYFYGAPYAYYGGAPAYGYYGSTPAYGMAYGMATAQPAPRVRKARRGHVRAQARATAADLAYAGAGRQQVHDLKQWCPTCTWVTPGSFAAGK